MLLCGIVVIFSYILGSIELHKSYLYLQISRVLEKYYVGELVTNEHPVFPEPGYVTII